MKNCVHKPYRVESPLSIDVKCSKTMNIRSTNFQDENGIFFRTLHLFLLLHWFMYKAARMHGSKHDLFTRTEPLTGTVSGYTREQIRNLNHHFNDDFASNLVTHVLKIRL